VTCNSTAADPAALDALADFVAAHPRLLVLTGAGVSTASGIPDYRDGDGAWKRSPPVQYADFVGDARTRRRYWARSLVGWRSFGQATPNPAHRALALLEMHGRIELLVTQNVDGLHQRAGSRRIIDLHGRLDAVVCLGCGHRIPREPFQRELESRNARFAGLSALNAPDGDADLDGIDFEPFDVPDCPICAGTMKPDVVFYGEGVPRERVGRALTALDTADALLVAGSSLMVFSGFRFARRAAERGQPIAAINIGRTRADDLIGLKITVDCATALGHVATALA